MNDFLDALFQVNPASVEKFSKLSELSRSFKHSQEFVQARVSVTELTELMSGFRPGPSLKPTEASLSMKLDYLSRGETLRQLQAFTWVRTRALHETLEALASCIKIGMILPTILCMRSALELIADTVEFENFLSGQRLTSIPCSFASLDASVMAYFAICAIEPMIHKATLSTRLDSSTWTTPIPDSSKAKKYSPKGEAIDVNANSILNKIDFLDKKTKGTRKTYELLSEYCHPNSGLYLLSKSHSYVDKAQGLCPVNQYNICFPPWKLRPNQQLSSPYDRISEAIDILTDACEKAEESLNKIGTQYDALKALTQALIKYDQGRYSIWTEFELCPCLSGKAIKACCWPD